VCYKLYRHLEALSGPLLTVDDERTLAASKKLGRTATLKVNVASQTTQCATEHTSNGKSLPSLETEKITINAELQMGMDGSGTTSTSSKEQTTVAVSNATTQIETETVTEDVTVKPKVKRTRTTKRVTATSSSSVTTITTDTYVADDQGQATKILASDETNSNLTNGESSTTDDATLVVESKTRKRTRTRRSKATLTDEAPEPNEGSTDDPERITMPDAMADGSEASACRDMAMDAHVVVDPSSESDDKTLQSDIMQACNEISGDLASDKSSTTDDATLAAESKSKKRTRTRRSKTTLASEVPKSNGESASDPERIAMPDAVANGDETSTGKGMAVDAAPSEANKQKATTKSSSKKSSKTKSASSEPEDVPSTESSLVSEPEAEVKRPRGRPRRTSEAPVEETSNNKASSKSTKE
jgi:hypothetical protein